MSELKAIESATAVIENVHMVYRKSEADKFIAELKVREDVLVTDNRDLLEKVKMLEERLRENAEHFKRNEAQILENADKVIADKDAKILALDAEVFKQKHHAKLFFDERNYAENQLRKQKYKRCLLMARWCDEVMMSCELRGYTVHRIWYNRHQWAMRWKYKWLEIAEKFKEAK